MGISDIGWYIPRLRIDLETLLTERAKTVPALDRRLRKAVESTGQKAIRFPALAEDSASLGANSLQAIINRRSPASLAGCRFLAAGTETTVDHSKAIGAYLQGMLQAGGANLPTNLSTFQVQHACAGGTVALLGIAAQLAAGGRPGEFGLVTCTDIARYEAPSTAEITQGAGAVGLLVESQPRLLAIDLATQGYASADVDDFFRPLDSITARVKGQYSMQCYNHAADLAFLDHCQRQDRTPAQVLAEYDYFVFHVPFARMAYTAARHLLTTHLHLVDGEVDDYLKPRGFFEAIETTAQVGNIYSGAVYLNLASLLSSETARLGSGIEGRRVLVASYGSGNTMIVFGATIVPGAAAVIGQWNFPSILDAQPAGFDDYQQWIDQTYRAPAQFTPTNVPPGAYYLSSIREDGYREYRRNT